MAADAPRGCPFHVKDLKQSPVVDVEEISLIEDDDVQTHMPNAPAITLPPSFKLRSVDARLQQPASTQLHHLNIRELDKEPELGILSKLKGTFQGDGFNTIFRPKNPSSKAAIKLGKVDTGISPDSINANPDSNILQLNLTKETVAFSPSLGETPNRGLDKQRDIFLNGVPYVHSVIDVTNTETGKPDPVPDPKNTIHFEPGLWMYVPGSTANPETQLLRMGCIPHGTTISATGSASPTTTTLPPEIFERSIIPLAGGKPPSLKVDLPNTSRLPQNLEKLKNTITQAMLDNPNSVLSNQNRWPGKKFIKTESWTVDSSLFPSTPGKESNATITNIPFLTGSTIAHEGTPNAIVMAVSATFWLSTVEYKIQLDPWKPGDKTPFPIPLRPVGAHAGAVVPKFTATPTQAITKKLTATVISTQLQYSQQVMLRFASWIDWPHVSVATLVPADTRVVDISAFK